ncbi:sodium/potassium/calcium exchanger 4-like [Rhopilema esculentum]|uniref:sodium/potassium/calcium exchanger 4-like n=1 Tax=Rhopilema esculentum TaxID=499914 RepID=UPI0031E2FA67|eukprot:gene9486-17218_t
MVRINRPGKLFIGIASFALFLLVRVTLEKKTSIFENVRAVSRQLLSTPLDDNCVTSKGAVEEFPKDFFTQEERLRGACVVHILVAFYMFALLAVVCDEYFVISLYHICARLDLDSNVAGATFMAIGSSAPTLFISVISIFFTESGGDVGLGTVVGSTIFNTLFIIATCGLAAKQVIYLTWYPLLRDSFMYTIGTVALVVTIRDREVYWYEATSFVVIYAMYIIVMYFNRSLESFFVGIKERYFGACSDDQNDSIVETTADKYEKIMTSISEELSTVINAERRSDNATALEIVKNKSISDLAGLNLGKNIGTQTTFAQRDSTLDTNTTKKADLSQFEHKQDSPFKAPDGIIAKIAWVLGMPVCLLFYITIPPCCKQRWSEWFLVTFLMSVLWMGTLSYVLVWMVCILGGTFNIPDCVMGMTFLAAGSSIPDVMASVIVARQGEGDMALSNAIGSNVFDMLCLGVPWLMKSTIMNPGTSVTIYSQSIMVSALLLIGSIFFTVLAIHLNNWKLDPKLGVIFLIVYVVFISLATLVEFIACPCQLEV